MIPTLTLARYIMSREREYPTARGELSDLLSALALGVKMIGSLVTTAGFKGLYGYTGNTNVQGEKTQKLDIEANEILVNILGSSGHFGLLISEETDNVVPTVGKGASGNYVVAFDPLDGSSNLGSNVPVGTIFAIYKRQDLRRAPSAADFMQPGSQVVAAGYSIYGSSTVFVYSCGDGVHEFTLDPTIGEFLLTSDDMRIPEKGGTYSINEGNWHLFDDGVKRFVETMKSKDEKLQTPYSARYVGSLVADFHRNLRKGGIFVYPADKKNARGKLRLLYECVPMAFIAEQAGGLAIDGTQRILDIIPKDVHERCPLIVGSKRDVELFQQFVGA